MDWGKWFRDNYDKHLLLLLFLVSLAFAIYAMNSSMNEGELDWARSKADQILGGLMTLIAGKMMYDKLNQKPPDPPAVP